LRRRDGEVFALLMATYPVTRFLVERLRDDEAAFVLGLTVSQSISLLVFVGGLTAWGYLRCRPPFRHADGARD